jgi:DNA-binding FadR family transcriptional regulator
MWSTARAVRVAVTTTVATLIMRPILGEMRVAMLPALGNRFTRYHLVEQDLCRQFGVSRTPVRGSLKLLAEDGRVESRANRGFILLKPVTDVANSDPIDPQDEEDKQLFIAIAKARNTGKLPVLASIDEHLAILTALEADRNQDAAVLMEGHLLASRRVNETIALVPELGRPDSTRSNRAQPT